MSQRRLVPLLLLAFAVGGGSAEVVIQTHRAITRARDVGSAGHFVELTLRAPDGEVIATPRVIAPVGKPAMLVLREGPGARQVRLALRLEAAARADGDVALDYELALPSREVISR